MSTSETFHVPRSAARREMLPNGRFSFEVFDATIEMAPPPSANKYLELHCMCIEKGPYEGWKAKMQLYLTEAAAWKFEQLHAAIGLDGVEMATANYIGRRFRGQTKQFLGIDQPFCEIRKATKLR